MPEIMAAPQFFLRTLGGASLEDSTGRTIELPSKVLALLVLLRLNVVCTRRDLEAFLWHSSRTSGNALSQGLSLLRHIFPTLPRRSNILHGPNGAELACDVDLLTLGTQDPQPGGDSVFLYRGRFLQGFPTESCGQEFLLWMNMYQAKCEALFRHVWVHEVANAITHEHWQRLERLGNHAISVTPWWPRGYATVIHALSSSGQVSAARRYYDAARRQFTRTGIDDFERGILERAALMIEERAAHERESPHDVESTAATNLSPNLPPVEETALAPDTEPSMSGSRTLGKHNVRDSCNLVFISYSHVDRGWLERLHVHLKPLERLGTIVRWDDTCIRPGTQWREEIQSALDNARVAVLLVTADFLASDFIVNNELPPLLRAAEGHGTIVLPVIVKPCRFEQTEGLSNFQAVNPPSEPLIALRANRREALFVKLSRTIEQVLRGL
jgi:hypothetical protein